MSNNYVEFYLHPVEDREGSIKAGHYVSKDIEYIKIMPPGGNLTVEKEVTDEIRNEYKPVYDAWKAGEEVPESGSPLKEWPPISPAQLKNCLSVKVRTVEQLANVDEVTLNKLGMGGRALKTKSIAWIDSAKNQGVASEEIAALKVQLEELVAQNTSLKEDVVLLNEQIEDRKEKPKRRRRKQVKDVTT